MGVALLSWYHTLEPVLRRGNRAFQSLVGVSSSGSDIQRYGSVVNEASPALVDLLRVGLVKYGLSGLLLGVGGLYLLVAVVESVSDRIEFDTYEVAFALAFVAFVAASVLFLFFDLVVGWGRVLLYVNIFGVLLTGPLFYKLYRRLGSPRVVTGAFCILLVFYTVFGVASLYHSPAKAEASHQVTDAEMEGAQWLLDNRNRFVGTVEYGISFYRFGDTYYGVEKDSRRELVDPNSPMPPPHFTYEENETYGTHYESDQYVIITTRGRDFYPEMYPDYRDNWRFTPEDFDRLERDPTVTRLYDNGNVDIYRTASQQ
jgi:hypothetical protein